MHDERDAMTFTKINYKLIYKNNLIIVKTISQVDIFLYAFHAFALKWYSTI